MWILKRIGDGKYVAYPGSEKSYTSNLRKAQTFPSKEVAERNMCPENEWAVDLEAEMER